MIDTNPSNLINKLIEISDLSTLSKFLIIHLDFLIIISLISSVPFLIMFMLESTPKYKRSFKLSTVLVAVITPILLFITTTIAMSKDSDFRQGELTKDQVVLIKAIPLPIFQEFVKDSIKIKGATISAIETAVSKYKDSNIEKNIVKSTNISKTELYSNLEKGVKGIGFYDSIASK